MFFKPVSLQATELACVRDPSCLVLQVADGVLLQVAALVPRVIAEANTVGGIDTVVAHQLNGATHLQGRPGRHMRGAQGAAADAYVPGKHLQADNKQ